MNSDLSTHRTLRLSDLIQGVFGQWTMVNKETDNGSKCRGWGSVEFSTTAVTSLSFFHQGSEPLQKGWGWNDYKSQDAGEVWSKEQCLLDTRGSLHSWIPSCYRCLHKTWVRPGQSTFQYGMQKVVHKPISICRVTVDAFWVRESHVFNMVGWPCSSARPHTKEYTCMGSTYWTLWTYYYFKTN